MRASRRLDRAAISGDIVCNGVALDLDGAAVLLDLVGDSITAGLDDPIILRDPSGDLVAGTFDTGNVLVGRATPRKPSGSWIGIDLCVGAILIFGLLNKPSLWER